MLSRREEQTSKMYGNGRLIFSERKTWISQFRLSEKAMAVAGVEEETRLPSRFS